MTAEAIEQLPLLASAPGGSAAIRRLILDLAVAGRLVPQDPADGSAEELIARAALAKVAIGPKRKSRGGTSQSGSRTCKTLPSGWAEVRLGELTTKLGAGSTPLGGKQVYTADGVMFLRSQNVWNEGLRLEDIARIPAAIHADMAGTHVCPGDLLFNITGASIGRCAVVPSPFEGGNVSQHVVIVRPALPELQAYLHKVLISDLVQDAVMAEQVGVSREGLSVAKLSEFKIPLPPLAEQHRIVAKLDELMALCDRLEARQQDAEAAHARLVHALLEGLTQARDAGEFHACWQRLAGQLEGVFTTEASIEDLERAVLELAISGRLTRAGSAGDVSADLAAVRQERARNLSPAKLKKHDADAVEVYWACPFGLPERWAWVSLAAVVLQITDGTHHTPTYIDDGTPFISVKDLDGETVSFEDCRRIPHEEHVAINQRCNPERGDILICRIGTLGRPTIVDTDRAFSIFVSVGLLKMPKSIELAEYVHLVLRSPLAYRQYDRVKAGGSHTNKLNLEDIPKIMVPLPPAEERAEILAVVREVLGLCSLLRSRIAAARAKHAQLAEALVAQAVAT